MTARFTTCRRSWNASGACAITFFGTKPGSATTHFIHCSKTTAPCVWNASTPMLRDYSPRNRFTNREQVSHKRHKFTNAKVHEGKAGEMLWDRCIELGIETRKKLRELGRHYSRTGRTNEEKWFFDPF